MDKITRPAAVDGETVRWKLEKNLYITINDIDGAPLEVFAQYGKSGEQVYGLSEALCRLVSLLLRTGAPLQEIIGQLDGIQESQAYPATDHNGQQVWISGIADGIAEQLKRYLDEDLATGSNPSIPDRVHEASTDADVPEIETGGEQPTTKGTRSFPGELGSGGDDE